MARDHFDPDKKLKSEVDYRDGRSPRVCGRCSMFREPADCTVVDGYISRGAVCNLWEPKRGSRG